MKRSTSGLHVPDATTTQAQWTQEQATSGG